MRYPLRSTSSAIRTVGTPLALCIGLTLVGCTRTDTGATSPSTTGAVATSIEDTSPPTTDRPKTPEALPKVPVMPLTGVQLGSVDEIPRRPALAVKIPMDDPAAMPQAGINKADIVFQTVINDRLTRLIAVFQSQSAEMVGPIRSGRDQDVGILGGLSRPLVASSGGNKGVRRLLRKADADGLIVDVDLGERGNEALSFRRRDRPPAPHNLFSKADYLWTATPDGFQIPAPIFSYFEPDEKPSGDAATAIDVQLDSVLSHWDYDPKSGRYYKLNNGKPHMSENDGQVWSDNVVVAAMEYGVSPIDAQNPLMKSVGSNKVFIFSNGTVREGIWVRFSNTDRWAFVDNEVDQNALELVPGRTWMEMPRAKPNVLTYSDGKQPVEAQTGPTTTAVASASTTAAP